MQKKQKARKPKWEWRHVKGSIKKNNLLISLTPDIALKHPNKVKLIVDIQKSLQFNDELGWNWHKSWNLPNISVKLQITDPITNQMLQSPQQITVKLFNQCNIYSSKTSFDYLNDNQLIDVGLSGNTVAQMSDNQAYFSGIKFDSTSYNNQGNNFQLIISLNIDQKVLVSVASPPVFVDSRKSARQGHQKKIISFVDPFHYELLNKQFVKRQSKKRGDDQIQILNDPEGFYNYLTAPNIRHKIRHPLFFAIKFSSCLKIYYKKGYFADQYFKKFQQVNRSTKNYSYWRQIRSGNQFKDKKMRQSIQFLLSQSIDIVSQDKFQETQNYIIIKDQKELFNAYKNCFEKLVVLSRDEQKQLAQPPLQKKVKLQKFPQPSISQQKTQPHPILTNLISANSTLQAVQLQNNLLKQLLMYYFPLMKNLPRNNE